MCIVVTEQARQSSGSINSAKDFLIFSMGLQSLGEGTKQMEAATVKENYSNFGGKTWGLVPIVFNVSYRPEGKSPLGHSFPTLICI